MDSLDRKAHWENIYTKKKLTEVSWYQPSPDTSLHFFDHFKVPTSAKIIDVGGGDSFLVDHLVKRGYSDITVVDISPIAIERAKKRLGDKAKWIKWIIADISDFTSPETYDFWHDRAAFHFLNTEDEISNYSATAAKSLNSGSIMVIGSFSEEGPTRCSGIEITQYSEESMSKRFSSAFNKIDCFKIDHPTPFGTTQNFIFCTFIKS